MILTEPHSSRRGVKLRDANLRRYTWGYIGAAAITVVGGAISSNQAKKSAGKAAPFENVDLQQQQFDAIQGNASAESSIEDLLARSNAFQQSQASSLAEQALPGFQKLSTSLTNRAQAMADHPYDVPTEVTQNIERLAAQRGISTGVRGQANDFSLLRDFGVNSLQYGESNIRGAESITGLLAGISPRVNPMSPLAFYVTPQQNAAAAFSNNSTNQAITQGTINAKNAAADQGNTDLWANLSKLAGAGLAAYGSKTTNPSTDYVTPNNYPIGSSGSVNGVSPAGAH